MPPEAARVWEYGLVARPLRSDVVVTVTAAPTMMERGCVAVCAVGAVLSVTLTEKFKVPAAVGVPEIVPAALRVRPVGSEPEASDHV